MTTEQPTAQMVVYDMPTEQEMLRTIVAAALCGDHGAMDWFYGKCTIGLSKHGYFLDYALHRGRASYETTLWRIAVYERDDFTCQDCGATDRLHAHHIAFWSEAPELRFEVANGLTLCPECHATRHPKQANLIRKSRVHA